MLIRMLDIVIALIGLVVALPVMALLLLIGFYDTGSPLFIQERVGQYKKPFRLIKFRTMKLSAASVATHLANAAEITRFGRFLRSSKLDELPQLWNVLAGDMSLVGPRPCLFNQEELISEREQRGVFEVKPGITGLGQVSDIDMSTPVLLAQTDQKMVMEMSVAAYFRYIWKTATGKGTGDRVRER